MPVRQAFFITRGNNWDWSLNRRHPENNGNRINTSAYGGNSKGQ